MPAMQETWVQWLGWEDPLEEKMAPHSSIVTWRTSWTEEPDRLWCSKESDTTEWPTLHFHTLRMASPSLIFSSFLLWEGNGNPLQYSCLENPVREEPGGLPSMGSHRVGHDWSYAAAAAYSRLNFTSVWLNYGFAGHWWQYSSLPAFGAQGSHPSTPLWMFSPRYLIL